MFHNVHEISSQLDRFMYVGMMIKSYKIVYKLEKNDFLSIAKSDATLMNSNYNQNYWSTMIAVKHLSVWIPSDKCMGKFCYEHCWNGNYKNNHNKCFYLHSSRFFMFSFTTFCFRTENKKKELQYNLFFRCFYNETKWKTQIVLTIFFTSFCSPFLF